MKEATGELNMTVITVIAIAAIATLFYIFVWPMIQRTIVNRTCETYGLNWHAVKDGDTWACCPEGVTSATDECEDAGIGEEE